MELSDKKILITGASGAIGGTTAIKLSKLGAMVVITGRDEKKLNDVFMQLHGSGHMQFCLDLMHIENIKPIIKKSINKIKYSGVIYCAGYSKTAPYRTLSVDMLDYTMRINFYPFIEIVKIITRVGNFEDKGGSIVAISSIASDAGEAGQTAYAASKAALDASIRTLSIELAQKKIRINSIRAGIINTQFFLGIKDVISDFEYKKLIEKQLMDMGQPEDVANAAAFLVSDDSRYMTGRYLYLDGGRFI